jgi:hypothetical protein
VLARVQSAALCSVRRRKRARERASPLPCRSLFFPLVPPVGYLSTRNNAMCWLFAVQPAQVRSNQSIGTFSNQLDGRTKHQHTVTQCLPNQWIGNVNCSQHGRACLHALARWSGFLQSRVFDRSPPRRGAWKVSERSSRNNIIPHLLVVILALSCC